MFEVIPHQRLLFLIKVRLLFINKPLLHRCIAPSVHTPRSGPGARLLVSAFKKGRAPVPNNYYSLLFVRFLFVNKLLFIDFSSARS